MTVKPQKLSLRADWDKDPDDYEMPGTCLNCDWHGTLVIPKGRRAPKSLTGRVECPRCGCREVVAV